MWIPTEHEKYGVGESRRGELYSALARAGAHFASLPLRPWRSAGLRTPDRGIALRAWGCGERAPGRGACAGGSPARAPERRDGGEARGQPSRCGVWSGDGACVSQVGRGGRTAFPSPSFAFLPGEGRGLRRFPGAGGRGRRQRPRGANTPDPEGGRSALAPALSRVPGVRNVARSSPPSPSPSASPASFPPPVLGCGGARVEGLGGLGTFQHLRPFGLCRGTGISAASLLPARGERAGGRRRTAVGWGWGGGARKARVLGAGAPRSGRERCDPGVRGTRSGVALAVLCKGEQQRTLMLTDEYRSLPSFPSSRSG